MLRSATIILTTFVLLTAALPVQAETAAQTETPAVEQFPETAIAPARVVIGNGPRDTMNVGVVSWRDWPFQTVKRQAYDFSCGSAAVATLMSYVYDIKVTEKQVFKAMFDAGDQEKIKREGFSMLDMSNFLNSYDLKTNGYKLPLASIEKNRVPFIALINRKGYNHFVVVKGVASNYVLVGDPNNGNVVYGREAFEKMWNGIALVVTNNARKARTVYNNPREWKLVRSLATLRESNNELGIDNAGLSPMPWQMAPAETDLFTITNDTITDARDLSTNTALSTTTVGGGL
jgi:uncharacterized protein